jgi:serine phosphatase RsbU (regulator of sigma subunit)/uncharacterized protein HemY
MKQNIVYLFLFTSLVAFGADDYRHAADSLKLLLNQAKHDSTRVRLNNELSSKYYNINVDSSMMYARTAFGMAISLKDHEGMADACSNLGDALYYSGKVEEAISEHNKAIEFYKKAKNEKGVLNSYISIGQAWKELGNYPKAIETYMLALKSADAQKEYDSKGRVLLALGVLFLDQDMFAEALKYSKEALPFLQQAGNKAQVANAYARIGNVFGRKENPAFSTDSTLYYYGLSLNLFTEIGHKRGIGVIYNNMAGIYSDNKEYKKAIDCYENALELRRELGDKNGEAIILNNLGTTYNSIKQHKRALEYLQQSLKIAREIAKADMISDNYSNIAETYGYMGDYKKAFEYKKRYIDVKDSMMNESNSRIITEMQTQYETEKKEKEIELLQQNKKVITLQMNEQKSKMKFQRYVIYAGAGVIIIVLIFSFFILRLFLQKKKANILLKEQYNEIMQQREEISSQRDEIEAQRDEIMAQRDLVISQKQQMEHILKNVTSSIRYAKQIQNSMLPATEFLNDTLNEHFIFYMPRDIVSGDFYWAAKSANRIFFCVADCTGHGVPGAFMSMLGISSLNEIVAQEPGLTPEKILDKLRERVIKSLKQKADSFEIAAGAYDTLSVKDGMDIALCILDSESGKLQFAGANNPIYIVGSKQYAVGSESPDCQLPTANCILTELKGDKMPIGIHSRMNPFTLQEMDVNTGDMIYLFSDGFADQTGGETGQKFKYKPFRELLTEVAGCNADEQKNRIGKCFKEWKGNHEQIDDVLIMGVRI